MSNPQSCALCNAQNPRSFVMYWPPDSTDYLIICRRCLSPQVRVYLDAVDERRHGRSGPVQQPLFT